MNKPKDKITYVYMSALASIICKIGSSVEPYLLIDPLDII